MFIVKYFCEIYCHEKFWGCLVCRNAEWVHGHRKVGTPDLYDIYYLKETPVSIKDPANGFLSLRHENCATTEVSCFCFLMLCIKRPSL